MDRGAWQAIIHGVARVGHNLVTKPLPPPSSKHITSIFASLLTPSSSLTPTPIVSLLHRHCVYAGPTRLIQDSSLSQNPKLTHTCIVPFAV